MAMAAMNRVSAGEFLKVSFHLRRCQQGVVSVLCKKTPIFGSRRSKLDHLMVLVCFRFRPEFYCTLENRNGKFYEVHILSTSAFLNGNVRRFNDECKNFYLFIKLHGKVVTIHRSGCIMFTIVTNRRPPLLERTPHVDGGLDKLGLEVLLGIGGAEGRVQERCPVLEHVLPDAEDQVAAHEPGADRRHDVQRRLVVVRPEQAERRQAHLLHKDGEVEDGQRRLVGPLLQPHGPVGEVDVVSKEDTQDTQCSH